MGSKQPKSGKKAIANSDHKDSFAGVKVLDPFGGGGAFALEALRLGCSVVVSNDLNPVAYLLQRATTELPLTLNPDFADQLLEWGGQILNRSRVRLAGIYGPDRDGTELVAHWWAWGLPCLRCGVWVPLLKTRLFLSRSETSVILSPRITDGDVGFGLETIQGKHSFADHPGNFTSEGAACIACGHILARKEVQLAGVMGQLSRRLLAICERVGRTVSAREAQPEDELLGLRHAKALAKCFAKIPYGEPDELLTADGDHIRAPIYGLRTFCDLFLPRQLLVIGTLLAETRRVTVEMRQAGISEVQIRAHSIYLALVLSRTVERASQLCLWQPEMALVSSAMVRFALPFCPDFAESNLLGRGTGSYRLSLEKIADTVTRLALSVKGRKGTVSCTNRDATKPLGKDFDLVITDPPYFDSIGYANLADYFYVWLRRALAGIDSELDRVFRQPLTPKRGRRGTELLVDRRRFGGRQNSLRHVQRLSLKALRSMHTSLKTNGRLVLVYNCAFLQGWAILAEAFQQVGFRVRAIWPVQTEDAGRPRAQRSRKLACSFWISCDKRPSSKDAHLDSAMTSFRRRVPDLLDSWKAWRLPEADRSWYLLAHSLLEFTNQVRVVDGPTRLSAQPFLRHVQHFLEARPVEGLAILESRGRRGL